MDVAQATLKTLGDHVAQVANKSVGGQGIAKSHAHISSVAERIYHSAEEARMQTPHRQSTMHTTDTMDSSQQSNTSSRQVTGDIRNRESVERPGRSQMERGDSTANQVSSEDQSDNSSDAFNEDLNRSNEPLTKSFSEQSSHFKTGHVKSGTNTQSVSDHPSESQSPWNQLPTNQEG